MGNQLFQRWISAYRGSINKRKFGLGIQGHSLRRSNTEPECVEPAITVFKTQSQPAKTESHKLFLICINVINSSYNTESASRDILIGGSKWAINCLIDGSQYTEAVISHENLAPACRDILSGGFILSLNMQSKLKKFSKHGLRLPR